MFVYFFCFGGGIAAGSRCQFFPKQVLFGRVMSSDVPLSRCLDVSQVGASAATGIGSRLITSGYPLVLWCALCLLHVKPRQHNVLAIV